MIEGILPGFSAIRNVHPMFVHFPIAFFLGALAMELIAILYHKRFHFVATWLLYLGVISALVTVATGLWAKQSLARTDPRGHAAPGHELIHIHRNWMLTITFVGALLSLYLFWINRKEKWRSHRWGLLAGLIVLSVLLTLGADRGARLVFEFGIGVNPEVLREAPLGEGDHHPEEGDPPSEDH